MGEENGTCVVILDITIYGKILDTVSRFYKIGVIHLGTLDLTVQEHISRRLGNLVLIPFEKVDIIKPLDAYGMDSMRGAEFRSWFYQAFKVDVPFLDLLNKTTTLAGLSERVVKEIESRNANSA